jgi:hypothetical protein
MGKYVLLLKIIEFELKLRKINKPKAKKAYGSY